VRRCSSSDFSLPGANEHAPNEWFPRENIEKGIRALAYLYEKLR
jgi:acetylornithine deacetylase/succinyl-diaminopimelate desuccinylase-like protein